MLWLPAACGDLILRFQTRPKKRGRTARAGARARERAPGLRPAPARARPSPRAQRGAECCGAQKAPGSGEGQRGVRGWGGVGWGEKVKTLCPSACRHLLFVRFSTAFGALERVAFEPMVARPKKVSKGASGASSPVMSIYVRGVLSKIWTLSGMCLLCRL